MKNRLQNSFKTDTAPAQSPQATHMRTCLYKLQSLKKLRLRDETPKVLQFWKQINGTNLLRPSPVKLEKTDAEWAITTTSTTSTMRRRRGCVDGSIQRENEKDSLVRVVVETCRRRVEEMERWQCG